jgi:hypothetical protein
MFQRVTDYLKLCDFGYFGQAHRVSNRWEIGGDVVSQTPLGLAKISGNFS